MRNDRNMDQPQNDLLIIIAVVSHCASIQGVQMMKQLNHSTNSCSMASLLSLEILYEPEDPFSISQRSFKSLFSDIKITNKVCCFMHA